MQAIGLMVLSTLCYTAMEAIAKDLVSTYPVITLLALRSSIVVVILACYGVLKFGSEAFKTQRPVIIFIRMLACFAAPYFFLLALRDIPLADATVIYFGGVFFIVALSRPILGERVGFHRTIAVLIGFAGVITVINPSFHELKFGSAAALLTAFFHSIAILLGRLVNKTENTYTLVFTGNLGLLLGSVLFLPWHWTPVAHIDLGMVLVFALMGLFAHFLIIHAFSLAPVGTVAPFEYTGVVWAAAIGYLVFDEVPTLNVITGATIVVFAGLYVLFLEEQQRRGHKLNQSSQYRPIRGR